jgi:multidrug efflux system membrane fusion protein
MPELRAPSESPPERSIRHDPPPDRRVAPSAVRAPRSRAWIAIVLVLILAAAGGGYLWWRHAQQQKAAAKEAASHVDRSVSVAAAVARKGDLPIYLTGLGTVKALNTVTMRARVDGQLTKVAYSEGQTVKEGDLLVEIDPRPFQVQLEQAEGQLARDQALLDNAKSDLARYKQASMAVTQQQIDTAASTVAQFEGAVRVDQAQIDNAKLQLDYCRITAPISGTIGLRLVDQGNMVHASDASGIAVITQMRPIAIEFTLPQDELPAVQAARAKGTLAAEVFDRELKHRLAIAELTAIDNQINISTGTILLKATYANEENALFSNQFVNVRLLVDSRRGAILVPSPAVQRSPQGAFVYLVTSESIAKMQPVTLGAIEGDTTQITEGLSEGDRVITDGVDKLRDGTKVAIREAGAAKTPLPGKESVARDSTTTKTETGKPKTPPPAR